MASLQKSPKIFVWQYFYRMACDVSWMMSPLFFLASGLSALKWVFLCCKSLHDIFSRNFNNGSRKTLNTRFVGKCYVLTHRPYGPLRDYFTTYNHSPLLLVVRHHLFRLGPRKSFSSSSGHLFGYSSSSVFYLTLRSFFRHPFRSIPVICLNHSVFF